MISPPLLWNNKFTDFPEKLQLFNFVIAKKEGDKKSPPVQTKGYGAVFTGTRRTNWKERFLRARKRRFFV